MQTLKSILKETGIHSKESLCEYIEKNRGVQSGVQLIVFDSIALHLDSELRVYDEELSFEKRIVDVPCLCIRNSQKITFKNCIFTGEVVISQVFEGMVNIVFDYCVFCKPLKIRAPRDGIGDISMTCVSAPEITLLGVQCKNLDISFCRIGHLLIEDSRVSELYTFCNSLKYLDIGSNQFENVSFSHRQVNISDQFPVANRAKMQKTLGEFNVFAFASGPDYTEMSDAEKKTLRHQTFEFLATYSEVGLNRKVAGHLKYLQSLSSQSNCFLRLLLLASGALVKPWRILLWIVIIIALFGCMFALPLFRFVLPGPDGSVVRSLFLTEAFYFSGISFTTIGYGDIAPLGLARIGAVLEGLIGIVLVSCLLVSFIRKYLNE